MSNPTVFELNKIMIRDNIFIIEDNIAESIHFHLGLVRFDLSIKEFNDISTKFINILNEQLNINNFDLNKQNEYFLEKIASSIPYIVNVMDEIVDINQLKYRFESLNREIIDEKLISTPVYQYYLGNKEIISNYELKRDIWQSKEELLESIKSNVTTDIYIDENNYILDGYKSLCFSLTNKDYKKLIKVKRIIFAKNKIPNIILKLEIKEW
ncbi:hypothetical protein LDK17_05710 [Fusobacterium polymorphum]|uniref:hypothetical protein n=1 Tax=Fusobacterium nucleatum subsp. polymorphum TaxID=76857 RepID=UPI0030CCD586